MSPKMGRPKAVNPMGVRLGIRLDAETYRNLMLYCRQNGTSISEAVRRAINLLIKGK